MTSGSRPQVLPDLVVPVPVEPAADKPGDLVNEVGATAGATWALDRRVASAPVSATSALFRLPWGHLVSCMFCAAMAARSPGGPPRPLNLAGFRTWCWQAPVLAVWGERLTVASASAPLDAM